MTTGWSTSHIEVRDIIPGDRTWIAEGLAEHFSSSRIVSRGVLHEGHSLPGLVAIEYGDPIAFLLYDLRSEQCEIVALVAVRERRGAATALLAAAARLAQRAGCRRLWLTTTNDNVAAIHFYERRGWRMVATHRGAMIEARKLKPELAEIGIGGVAIVDELEFEWPLDGV
jgi:ribosomal protein S18 acetylase RimI-like enzyme